MDNPSNESGTPEVPGSSNFYIEQTIDNTESWKPLLIRQMSGSNGWPEHFKRLITDNLDTPISIHHIGAALVYIMAIEAGFVAQQENEPMPEAETVAGMADAVRIPMFASAYPDGSRCADYHGIILRAVKHYQRYKTEIQELNGRSIEVGLMTVKSNDELNSTSKKIGDPTFGTLDVPVADAVTEESDKKSDAVSDKSYKNPDAVIENSDEKPASSTKTLDDKEDSSDKKSDQVVNEFLGGDSTSKEDKFPPSKESSLEKVNTMQNPHVSGYEYSTPIKLVIQIEDDRVGVNGIHQGKNPSSFTLSADFDITAYMWTPIIPEGPGSVRKSAAAWMSQINFDAPRLAYEFKNRFVIPLLDSVKGISSELRGLESLPPEIVMPILTMSSAQTVLSVGLVSTYLNSVADSRVVWRKLVLREFGDKHPVAEDAEAIAAAKKIPPVYDHDYKSIYRRQWTASVKLALDSFVNGYSYYSSDSDMTLDSDDEDFFGDFDFI